MEMTIRSNSMEYGMDQKSSTAVSEWYKEFSNTVANQKDMKAQEGTGKQQERCILAGVLPNRSTMRNLTAGKHRHHKSRDNLKGKDILQAYQECNELTEGMKENLIDKVLVYEGGRIEIVWSYGDCLEV